MTYILKITQRALALIQEGYSAERVSDIVSKEFDNEPKTPCAQTVRRWRNEADRWEKRRIESAKSAKEFVDTHPIPPWLKNVYLVKIENGEIKFF